VGTPAYASPEQLRGDRVDTRTDVYGVGATLYELVTGHPPFDKPDLMSLLMAVANEAPRPPHRVNRTVPRGLSHIIQRCLSKKPERRFTSHTDLAAALQTYSSSVAPAAPLGRRGVATLIDHLILLAMFFWVLRVSGFPSEVDSVRLLATLTLAATFWRVAYFALLEGVWGASIGKALAGIRIAGSDGRPAGPLRALCRSVLFVLAFDACYLVPLAIAPEAFLGALDAPPGGVLGFLLRIEVRLTLSLIVLFCTARSGNGFAGVHDLVTRTRVVERRSVVRPAVAPAVVDAPQPPIARVGPYDVLTPSIDGMQPEWRFGFDPILSRPVLPKCRS